VNEKNVDLPTGEIYCVCMCRVAVFCWRRWRWNRKWRWKVGL